MLALDHGESFREMLEQMNPGGVDDALIIEIKKQIKEASGQDKTVW